MLTRHTVFELRLAASELASWTRPFNLLVRLSNPFFSLIFCSLFSAFTPPHFPLFLLASGEISLLNFQGFHHLDHFLLPTFTHLRNKLFSGCWPFSKARCPTAELRAIFCLPIGIFSTYNGASSASLPLNTVNLRFFFFLYF